MKRVVIESPFGSLDWKIIRRNIIYARLAVRDSLERGEAPWCSHLFYPQPGILNDHDSSERSWGINAGLVWGADAELRVVYEDLGMTPGMELGIASAREVGQTIEFRKLSSKLKSNFDLRVEQDPLNEDESGSGPERLQTRSSLIAAMSQHGIWL